ncbi:hypothetical protein Tco_1549958 [Tanacetum coccineum]
MEYMMFGWRWNGRELKGIVKLRSTQQCMKSVIQSGLSKIFWVEDTTRSTYQVNGSPSSAIGFKKHIDMLGFFGWLASIKNMGFNKSRKYKKTFIGSGVGTGSVQVLQGVEFEVEPQEDHTFEVEPHGNINHVVGS